MRYVLDLSALIEIRRAGLQPRLNRLIDEGQIAMVSFALKKLRSARWKDWRDRHNDQLVVRLNPGPERRRYGTLIVEYRLGPGQPTLAEDDIMAITVAEQRGWPLVMRDHAATRVAESLGVRCISVEDFLLRLAPRAPKLPGFED